MATTPPTQLPLNEASTALSAKVGEVIEEQVTVVVPEDMYFVDIVVPLAAGLEPLNPRLATASSEATPTGQDTRTPEWSSFLDDRVIYAYETLPKGTYHLYFRTRGTTEGHFVQPAATARKVYQPQVRGTSAGARVTVSR